MVAIILLLAAYGLMFGAKGLWERLVSATIGLALVVTVLPGFVLRWERAQSDSPSGPSHPGRLWIVIIGVPLTLLGFAAWRTRAARQRARAEARRLNEHPREREMPVAPERDEEGPTS